MRDVLHSEDVTTMQEIFGYCLHTAYPAQKVFWFNGSGRNGKTTTVELLRKLLGEDNVTGVSLSELDGGHRFSLQRLFGKMLNVMAEPGTQKLLQTQLLKSLTGWDMIYAEKKGVHKTFHFLNYAKFIVYGNAVPQINDTSLAFSERLLVIDFPHTFIGDRADKEHGNTLITANGLSGLLNWALEGLKRLQGNNWEFSESQWQKEAKAHMMRQSQPVNTFLSEWTEFNNRAVIEREYLYDVFKEYCDRNQILVLEYNKFAHEVKQKSNVKLVRNQSSGLVQWQWHGLEIKKDVEESIQHKEIEESLDIEYATL